MFAEVFDLGLVLQWDRGTRVYIRADPKWKDRVSELMTSDDFRFQLLFIHPVDELYRMNT